MDWIDVGLIEPPRERNLICYCPQWNDSGYQIAKWNGEDFVYDEQPNLDFSGLVLSWCLFLEAD